MIFPFNSYADNKVFVINHTDTAPVNQDSMSLVLDGYYLSTTLDEEVFICGIDQVAYLGIKGDVASIPCYYWYEGGTPTSTIVRNNRTYSSGVSIFRFTNTFTTNTPFIERFSNTSDFINAINNYTPVSSAKSYYTLQNGWLSVIDLGSNGANYEFDLDTSFQMNSGLLSGTWGNGTSQRYWFSNDLPDENTSYLSTFGNAIEWEKGYPRNVFGQTKNATCTISGTSSGRYLYILNPALQQIADVQNPSVSPGVNNQPMIISGLIDGMSAKIYKLTGTATLDGLNNAVDVNSGGSVTASDTSSDLTNGFTNSDDETVVQNAGGGNENEVAQSVNGYLQGIQNALDNFVNQFIGLLSAPISHIQQMIESGSNFFSVFGQLFTWLPEEISVIITGSLLVMVIIGVFKMFL